MTIKELEVQRALGTLNTYWVEIQFPRREEPKGLDQLMSKVIPNVIRFYNGEGSIFITEATLLHIEAFIRVLTELIHRTDHNRGHETWLHVYEPASIIGDRYTTIFHDKIK